MQEGNPFGKPSRQKRIGVSDDPLSFWKVCRNEMSALAKLARLYLSPSPSSNDSLVVCSNHLSYATHFNQINQSSDIEREFKMAKFIQKDRVRLLHIMRRHYCFLSITSERVIPHRCFKYLMILFRQMIEFIITWILMWNKRSHLTKVFKFLIHDLCHFPIPRLEFAEAGVPCRFLVATDYAIPILIHNRQR